MLRQNKSQMVGFVWQLVVDIVVCVQLLTSLLQRQNNFDNDSMYFHKVDIGIAIREVLVIEYNSIQQYVKRKQTAMD